MSSKSSKFVLVGYLKKNGQIYSTSVAPIEAIQGTVKKDATVTVFYGTKPYQAKVMRTAADYGFLEKLQTTTEGKIQVGLRSTDSAKKTMVRKSRGEGPNKTLAAVKKKQTKLGQQSLKSLGTEVNSKPHVLQQNNAIRKGSRSSQKTNSLESEKPQTAAQEKVANNSSVVDAEKIVPQITHPVLSENELLTSNENLAPPVDLDEVAEPPSSSATTIGDTIQAELSKEEHIFLLKVLRNPQAPKVTAAGINALEHMLQFYKLLHSIQLVEARKLAQEQGTTSNPKLKEATLEEVLFNSGPGPNKVELVLGSGVYVNEEDKRTFTNSFASNPLEVMRRLMKNIVGLKPLTLMGAKGSGTYVPIPPFIYDTIHDYIYNEVLKNAKKKPTASEYVQAVNVMCGNLRKKFGVSDPSLIKSSPGSAKRGRKKNEDQDEDMKKEKKKEKKEVKKSRSGEEEVNKEQMTVNDIQEDQPQENLESSSETELESDVQPLIVSDDSNSVPDFSYLYPKFSTSTDSTSMTGSTVSNSSPMYPNSASSGSSSNIGQFTATPVPDLSSFCAKSSGAVSFGGSQYTPSSFSYSNQVMKPITGHFVPDGNEFGGSTSYNNCYSSQNCGPSQSHSPNNFTSFGRSLLESSQLLSGGKQYVEM